MKISNEILGLTLVLIVIYYQPDIDNSEGRSYVVSEDLLEILRCPYCVSGDTRKPGDDPGQLELVHDTWLVCQEPDCQRKYPIREDIPVMLIEEGDKWADTDVDDLPVPPPTK